MAQNVFRYIDHGSQLWQTDGQTDRKKTGVSNAPRLGSLDDTVFVAKLSGVRNWPDWGLNYSVASCLASVNSSAQENRWHLNSELPFLAQCCLTALVQRMSNCDKIQNTVLTLLNVLIYGSVHFDGIQYDGEHKVWIHLSLFIFPYVWPYFNQTHHSYYLCQLQMKSVIFSRSWGQTATVMKILWIQWIMNCWGDLKEKITQNLPQLNRRLISFWWSWACRSKSHTIALFWQRHTDRRFKRLVYICNFCDCWWCGYAGGSFDVNIQADGNDVTECSGVDAPNISMFVLRIY